VGYWGGKKGSLRGISTRQGSKLSIGSISKTRCANGRKVEEPNCGKNSSSNWWKSVHGEAAPKTTLERDMWVGRGDCMCAGFQGGDEGKKP